MRTLFPKARRPLAALLAAFIAFSPLAPAWSQVARPGFPAAAPSGLIIPGAELGLLQRFPDASSALGSFQLQESQDLLQRFLSLPPQQGLSYLDALASDEQVPATQEQRAQARALLSLLARPEGIPAAAQAAPASKGPLAAVAAAAQILSHSAQSQPALGSQLKALRQRAEAAGTLDAKTLDRLFLGAQAKPFDGAQGRSDAHPIAAGTQKVLPAPSAVQEAPRLSLAAQVRLAAPTPSRAPDGAAWSEEQRPPKLIAHDAAGRFTIENVRWGRKDAAAHFWETARIDPKAVEEVYWGNIETGVGHSFLVFRFKEGAFASAREGAGASRLLAVSVEARMKQGQAYNPVAGLFGAYPSQVWNLYTLEDWTQNTLGELKRPFSLYPLQLSALQKEQLAALTLSKAVLDHGCDPYNTLTNNCATNSVELYDAVVTAAQKVRGFTFLPALATRAMVKSGVVGPRIGFTPQDPTGGGLLAAPASPAPAAAPGDPMASELLGRSDVYRSLLAEERTPADLKAAGYVADWSALTFYKPARIVKPKTELDIAEALRYARDHGLKVSMAGTRHSMGGQAMRDGSVFLDMTEFRGASYNAGAQTVTVRGGTNWIDLQLFLEKYGRTVAVKQASSVFSIAGSISSNIHGEDFRFGTIGNTVKSLKLMLADGSIVSVSREQNPELFAHAIGGYGLFGIILEAELQTAPDEKYEQKFQSIPIAELPKYVKEKLLTNPDMHFFLTELAISPYNFLTQALVNTWEKVTKEGDAIPPFTPGDGSRLHVLIGKIPYWAAIHSHWLGKAVLWALEKYVQPLIMQRYVGRNDALTLDYDMIRIPAKKDTQVLQELFVPVERYNELIPKIQALRQKYDANVVYSSTRFVKQDTLSALPFAKGDFMSLVIYRDEKKDPATKARMEQFYREAADAAVSLGGTFYLTYQLPYTRAQMLQAYPNLDHFFEVKRKYDPGELFVNSLYDKYGKPTTDAAPALSAVEGPSLSQAIEHVVVLMLENRSFDNMLGFLKEQNPEIDGLTGKETNPVDPADPAKGTIPVTRGARYFGDANPGHEPERVQTQLYGQEGAGLSEAKMNGFVADYLKNQPKSLSPAQKLAEAGHIMDAFTPEQVPVFARLAKEFVVADRWFASAPTSTFPNRAFLQTGTSNGELHSAGTAGDPTFKKALFGDTYAGRTLYDNLMAAAKRWKIYYHDIVWSFLIPGVRQYPEHVTGFKNFKKDAAKGALPAFSLIEPAYVNTPYHKANDDDAPHDVREGQRLVAEVYNALRANEEAWKKTLLVITYDEHGGYHDHVPPPAAVSPDGKTSKEPAFDFTRLGVRVPTLLVSPWLPKGAVDHTIYDHTSILKFVEERFNLPHLSERDRQANSFGRTLLAEARSDTPKELVPPASGSQTNTDPRLYDPSEPQGLKAAAGAFLMGTGMKTMYYLRHLPSILARKFR